MRNLKHSLALLLATTSAYAEIGSMSCIQESTLQSFGTEMIEQLAPLKECPTEDQIILGQVEAEYKKLYGALPQVIQPVKGFKLKGSLKELNLANKMLGAKPPKNWAAAAKDCSTILCAFEKLFNSKEAAMQVFNAHAKSGYTLSLDQSINQNMADQHWSAKEVRELDAALSKLPKELRQLPKLDEIDRLGDGLRKSGHSSNVAAFASPGITGYKEADLVVYDAGVRGLTNGKSPYETTSWPQEALIHEICHHHDFKGLYATDYGAMTSEQKNSVFKGLSGWKEKTEKNGGSSWVHAQDGQFVSSYAATSPAEDYAESCMNYILHPETLEKKAPKKYAHMKKYVFNGAEFKDKPWTKEQKIDWPKLNQMIADESGCSDKLIKCSQGLEFESDGMFSMITSTTVTKTENGSSSYSMSSYGSAETLIKNSECYKNFKSEKAKQIEEALIGEDDYCAKGGPRIIKREIAKTCAATEKSLLSSLDAASKVNVTSAVANCEAARDFTQGCVLSQVASDLKVSEEFAPSVKKIIASKIPNRMTALEGQLAKTPSSQWLKGCLESISEIDVYHTTDEKTGLKENLFQYTPDNDDYSSGFLGRHVWEGSKSKDVNMSCSQEILESLEDSGVKVPETGNPVVLVTKTFRTELKTFEDEVIEKLGESTKKCLFKKCKIEKATELIKSWESRSPESRSGLADEDFVEELLKKVEAY